MSDAPGPSRGSQLLKEWRGDATQAQAAKLVKLDPASYNRFENGVRRPPAPIGFELERLTDGRVPAKSWYEPPVRQSDKQVRAS